MSSAVHEPRAWQCVEPAGLGLSLVVPGGTDVVCELPLVMSLPAIDGLRPHVVLEFVRATAPLEAWHAETMAAQLGSLELALLVSRERCEVFGNEGRRTVLQHALQGRARTVVQWWTVVQSHGCVLTASCWTPHYDLLADVFCEIFEGVRFDDE
jgi:hypothetical protein